MIFTWDVNPMLLHIAGGIGIRYYGLLFSLVFVGGFFLFRWQVMRAGGTEDDAYAIVVPGALGTVIGARLGHCLFYNLEYTLRDPLWVFRIWEGGLASHGALIGLLLAIAWYARSLGQSYLECLDRFTFSAALGSALVRIGNFFNSEIVGRLTDQTWGVRFPRFDQCVADLCPLRHPSQLYEATMGFFILGLLWVVDRALGRENRPRGAMTGTFLIAYFSGRFMVEFFKEYQVLRPSVPLTMGQFLSIPAVIGGLTVLGVSLYRRAPARWNPPAPAPKPKGAARKKKRR